MMASRVRKAVLPVAGLGTRFLPVTKAVPKEMLPICDRPGIELIVAEAVEAGLTELILVVARGKEAIVDYFHRSPALEAHLEATGKLDLAREVRRVGELATVMTMRQEEALGLGHAVRTAAAAVGDEDFAVLLGDDVIDAKQPAIGQLLDVHAERGGCVVALMPVPPDQTNRYGVIGGERVSERPAARSSSPTPWPCSPLKARPGAWSLRASASTRATCSACCGRTFTMR